MVTAAGETGPNMPSPGGVVAAIGNFDGVHLGHQHLLRLTAAFASSLNATPGVVVFDPHPRRYFRPDEDAFLLTTSETRLSLLRDYGAQSVITLAFDKGLASLSPEAFVGDVLCARLGLKGVVAGTDFRFGAKRAGDGEALIALGEKHGLAVKLVDILAENPAAGKFGSSAVREALRKGDVMSAATMLGRPWRVKGQVCEGQKLGRTIGFPTANITLGELIEPRKGVYATRAVVDGKAFDAVSNFGRRPTVGAPAPLLETHLFGFKGDLYGAEIEVAFHDFLRDEQKFDGLDALQAQISKDCVKAKERLAQICQE